MWQVQFRHGSAPWPCVSPAVSIQPPTNTGETERSCLQEGGASWQYGNVSGQLLLDFQLWNQDSLEKKKKSRTEDRWLFSGKLPLRNGIPCPYLTQSIPCLRVSWVFPWPQVLQLWNCKAGIFIVMLGREQHSWLRGIQIHDKCELIETLLPLLQVTE